ncbi:hypothetical protein D0838_09835 [Bordetella avium]|nr:hypothetical protein C0J09_06535 [Bordetella avium]AZY52213.1 hypothetical protein C0J07_06605 [Bordetella avium]RIQ54486.1 hypothetical protein D0843_02710 [Bordetella avium]RIQ71017.1 hypothetical protein D0838_09835 [Bordetella avium]
MDRLDHLEKRVDNIDGRLERIEGDVATLKDDVGGIKTALVSLEGGLTAKFEALRADIHQSIAENSKWTHAATIGMFSVFILGGIGLLFTIWNATKPAPVAAQYPQPAPIIINVPATHPTLQPPARMPLQPSQIPEIAPEIGK